MPSFIVAWVLLIGAASAVRAGVTEIHLISTSIQGGPSFGDSARPRMSADGTVIAFESGSSVLVNADGNGEIDAFVHDESLGAIERVSVSSAGAEGNGESAWPVPNASGRYVVFQSRATNLVPGDTNGCWDIFLRDRLEGRTERVSVSSLGAQANADCVHPAVSFDGRYVAFVSAAITLGVPDIEGVSNAFVRDRLLGTTVCVSRDRTGGPANGFCDHPAISGDGSTVAFESEADDLTEQPDTNFVTDIYAWDRRAPKLERISVSTSGAEGELHSTSPSVSADGQLVAFASASSTLDTLLGYTLHDVYVRLRPAGVVARGLTRRVGQGEIAPLYPGFTRDPSLSPDGTHVAFSTSAPLQGSDTNGAEDVYVTRLHLIPAIPLLQPVDLERVNQTPSGVQADDNCYSSTISGSGRRVGFQSLATTLVTNREGNQVDVFRSSRTALGVSTAPIADAGPDQVVTPRVGTLTPVRLDGSGSRDVDGDLLLVSWRLGAGLVASGFRPLISLTRGRHRLTVTAFDRQGNNHEDTVTVTVGVGDATAETTVAVGLPVPIRRGSKDYEVLVTITSTGDSNLPGPVSLVLDGLPPSLSLLNVTGTTAGTAPGPRSPYVNTLALAPGASVDLVVRCRVKSGVLRTFPGTQRVLVGKGPR